MLRSASVIVALSFGLPAASQEPEASRDLAEALGITNVIEIMVDEGIAYGADLEQEMFPGRGGATWTHLVRSLYNGEAMRDTVLDGFSARMEGVDHEPLLTFFTSDLGREIIALELEARRALLDDDVEIAAEQRLAEMQDQNDPRLDLLADYVKANDLVEQNVVGAMNANYAFFTGLMDAGAFDGTMTEDQVLGDVWAQEADIRADTLDWVYSYLSLAYQPLSDAEIETYTELSRSEPGRAMNDALFGAFDRMYTEISRGLGAGAAKFMSGQDI